MTDALSLAALAANTTAPAGDRRQSTSTSPLPPYQQYVNPGPPFMDGPTEDDDGEIACICAFTDDDGATIQCDKCLRWQHIICYYPDPKDVPGEDQSTTASIAYLRITLMHAKRRKSNEEVETALTSSESLRQKVTRRRSRTHHRLLRRQTAGRLNDTLIYKVNMTEKARVHEINLLRLSAPKPHIARQDPSVSRPVNVQRPQTHLNAVPRRRQNLTVASSYHNTRKISCNSFSHSRRKSRLTRTS